MLVPNPNTGETATPTPIPTCDPFILQTQPAGSTPATPTRTPTYTYTTTRSNTPSPTHTPTSLVTLVGSYCSLQPSRETFVLLHRNPIPGTLAYPERFKLNRNNRIVVDKYSVDVVQNRLWFHLREKEVPSTPVGGNPNESWYGWVMIASPSAGGSVKHPKTGDTIRIPLLDNNSLSIHVQEINICLKNVTFYQEIWTVADLSESSWDVVAPNRSPFSFFPVSINNLCSIPLNNERLWGFGYQSSKYKTTQGYHMGVDFPAPPGSRVYSIANGGVVVGISQGKPDLLEGRYSQGNWGGSYVTSGSSNDWGYGIIIRYGIYFVLYGHISQVNPDIYVGKLVKERDILGDIGLESNGGFPHLHIEVRFIDTNELKNKQYYEIIPTQPFLSDSTPSVYNKFGILSIGRNAPLDWYDVTQFFPSNVLAFRSDSSLDTTTVHGLGMTLEFGQQIDFGGQPGQCKRIYSGSPVPRLANGIRGFRNVGNQSPATLPDVSTPPSYYPTLTPPFS
jgi:hypothetical protein